MSDGKQLSLKSTQIEKEKRQKGRTLQIFDSKINFKILIDEKISSKTLLAEVPFDNEQICNNYKDDLRNNYDEAPTLSASVTLVSELTRLESSLFPKVPLSRVRDSSFNYIVMK